MVAVAAGHQCGVLATVRATFLAYFPVIRRSRPVGPELGRADAFNDLTVGGAELYFRCAGALGRGVGIRRSGDSWELEGTSLRHFFIVVTPSKSPL